MIGKTISHYKILDKLGEGGMGVVYKAEDTRLKRSVALKFLTHAAMGKPEDKTRFMHEAQAAAALNHPNICTVYEIEEYEGQPFIAMEYVPGHSLKETISNRQLTIDEFTRIAMQIATGLNAAHEQKIIHRDMKCDNVMLTEKDDVKIMDFGLAKLPGRTLVTQAGSTLGTINYMSPEQARGEKVDPRTDIWSFGVMLYEMLSGQLPFKGEYEQAVVYSIINEQPEPPTALRSGVPMGLERIVLKALEKDRKNRYQHMDEMLTDLRKTTQVINHESKKRARSPKRHLFSSSLFWMGVLLFLGIFFGTLIVLPQKSISFEKRDWVLISDFENTTGNEVFNGAIEEALARELRQSQYVNIVSPEREADVLRMMKKKPGIHIGEQTAREIALRDGEIRAILGGTIRQIGQMFDITVHLIDPASGTRVTSFSEDANSLNDILPAIRKLSNQVRGNLGESLSELAPLKIIGKTEWYEKVTTANFKALQLYRRGYRYANQFNWSKALLFMQQAIKQDSSFAMAYVMAGFMYSNTGRSAQARPFLEKALSLSEGLTDREKYFIRGGHAFIMGDWKKAIEQFTILVELFPDDFWGQMNLGVSYAWMQQFQKAFNHLKQAARIRPNDPGTLGVILLFEMSAFEDLESSKRYYQQIKSIAPEFDFASYKIFRPMKLWIQGDVQGAKKELQQTMERALGHSPWTQWTLFMARANIDVFTGNFQNASEWLDKTSAFGREIKAFNLEVSGMSHKGLLFMELGDDRKFENIFHRMMDKFPEPIAGDAAGWLAYDALRKGQSNKASSLIRHFKKNTMDLLERQAFLQILEGKLAQLEKHPETAIKHFRNAQQLVKNISHPPPNFYSPLLAELELAEAYEKKQQWDMAIKMRREIIGHKIKYLYPGFIMAPYEWVKAHYHLGLLYEKKGNIKQAREYYKNFINFWRLADRSLPEIEDAEKRLAHLSADIKGGQSRR